MSQTRSDPVSLEYKLGYIPSLTWSGVGDQPLAFSMVIVSPHLDLDQITIENMHPTLPPSKYFFEKFLEGR